MLRRHAPRVCRCSRTALAQASGPCASRYCFQPAGATCGSAPAGSGTRAGAVLAGGPPVAPGCLGPLTFCSARYSSRRHSSDSSCWRGQAAGVCASATRRAGGPARPAASTHLLIELEELGVAVDKGGGGSARQELWVAQHVLQEQDVGLQGVVQGGRDGVWLEVPACALRGGGRGGDCGGGGPAQRSTQRTQRTLTPRMWNSNSARCIFCTAATKLGALQMTLTSCGRGGRSWGGRSWEQGAAGGRRRASEPTQPQR